MGEGMSQRVVSVATRTTIVVRDVADVDRDYKPPRYTSIDPPPDNGCAACKARDNMRAFCDAHREEWKRGKA